MPTTYPSAAPDTAPHIQDPACRNLHLTSNERELLDAGEMLWIALANVSGGDWSKQSEDWQLAARRWVDHFHNVAARLDAHVA